MTLNLTNVIKGANDRVKKIRFWKSRFLVIGLIVAVHLSGCSDFKEEDSENIAYQPEQQERKTGRFFQGDWPLKDRMRLQKVKRWNIRHIGYFH